MAWVFKQLNDLPKALYYSERYIELSDSLKTESYEKEIATLEAKYKSAENSKKINLLDINYLMFWVRFCLKTFMIKKVNNIPYTNTKISETLINSFKILVNPSFEGAGIQEDLNWLNK